MVVNKSMSLRNCFDVTSCLSLSLSTSTVRYFNAAATQRCNIRNVQYTCIISIVKDSTDEKVVVVGEGAVERGAG